MSRGQARDIGLYSRELRMSLRNNAGAYGYSVTITCALAVLTALDMSPNVGQVFLFLLGAVASFAVIEVIATHAFTRSLGDGETTKVIALGSSLSLFSTGLAVGAAALCGLVLRENLGWFFGAFAGSTVYLLTTALEMSVARRIEEARNLK